MSKPDKQCIDYFGASVRGPSNRYQKKLKQDAWLGIERSWGHLIVVCDGMGSKEFARDGAVEACAAVRDSIQLWKSHKNAPIEFLFHTIDLIWRYRIHPLAPNKCSTTCMFSFLNRENNLIVAQLGDGACVIRDCQGEVTILDDTSNEGFTNTSRGLGATVDVEKWNFIEVKDIEPGCAILLATDGVSEDVERERLGGMTLALISEYRHLDPKERWINLCKELRDWSTPHHLDDKTIAAMWVEPFLSGENNCDS
jgi:serine/threonine protein phosphatase PrpC